MAALARIDRLLRGRVQSLARGALHSSGGPREPAETAGDMQPRTQAGRACRSLALRAEHRVVVRSTSHLYEPLRTAEVVLASLYEVLSASYDALAYSRSSSTKIGDPRSDHGRLVIARRRTRRQRLQRRTWALRTISSLRASEAVLGPSRRPSIQGSAPSARMYRSVLRKAVISLWVVNRRYRPPYRLCALGQSRHRH